MKTVFSTLLLVFLTASAQPTPLQPLPTLDVASYMGTWYQVLWFPNRFQKQCVADTSANYRDLGNGTLEVSNRCRTADGSLDAVVGIARPPAGVSRIDAGKLLPARLEVSFLPAWLRWTGVGWGAPIGLSIWLLTADTPLLVKPTVSTCGFSAESLCSHRKTTA